MRVLWQGSMAFGPGGLFWGVCQLPDPSRVYVVLVNEGVLGETRRCASDVVGSDHVLRTAAPVVWPEATKPDANRSPVQSCLWLSITVVLNVVALTLIFAAVFAVRVLRVLCVPAGCCHGQHSKFCLGSVRRLTVCTWLACAVGSCCGFGWVLRL